MLIYCTKCVPHAAHLLRDLHPNLHHGRTAITLRLIHNLHAIFVRIINELHPLAPAIIPAVPHRRVLVLELVGVMRADEGCPVALDERRVGFVGRRCSAPDGG